MILNLGCGFKKYEDAINCDINFDCNPDIVCDGLQLPFGDASVDSILAFDFLEHIPNEKRIDIIEEIWRVLKVDGIFESATPDAEYGQGAFQDPTHLSFWCENSWLYYSMDRLRKLYNIKANFEIEKLSRVKTGERVFHICVKAIKRSE